MPLLVALETAPFIVLLLLLLHSGVYVHRLSLPAECLLRYCMPSALRVATQVSARGTCRATCSVLRTAGGGNLLEAPRLLVTALIALADTMRLVVGMVSLALLVHNEDMLLPLVVVLGNPYPDAGDDQCE